MIVDGVERESLFYEKNLTQGGRRRHLTFGRVSDWISLLISFLLEFGGKVFFGGVSLKRENKKWLLRFKLYFLSWYPK